MNDGHWSDCAVYNEPAYPAGLCDCGGLDLAAYERYVAISALIPTPGALGRFVCDGVLPSLIETEQLPPDSLAADTSTPNLPNPHDRVAIARGANSVDLNNARIAVVSDGKVLPGAQSLTSNMPPHNDSPDSIARVDSTPGDGV